MSRPIEMYKLLLSCPGDAYSACYPEVINAVNEFNKDAKDSLSISVNLTHWSTDSYPQSGGHSQSLLNSQIVDEADAAIAIFWTRFGTPTDQYGSGTEEEIDRLITLKRQVFLYFLDKPVSPSMTDSLDYIENRKKILALKQKYNGIYCEVKNETALKNQLLDHLKHYFMRKNNNNSMQKANTWTRSDTGGAISPNELIKHHNTVTQIDGNIARTEIHAPEGKTIYAEVDLNNNAVKHVSIEGYPQEYTLGIPQNIILNKQDGLTIISGIEYRAEKYTLKFGGYLTAIFDKASGKMQDVDAKAPAGMLVNIDIANKLISFIDNDVVSSPKSNVNELALVKKSKQITISNI